MRTLKKTVVLSLSSLLVATAWSGCGTSSNPEVEDPNQSGFGDGDDAGSDASAGDGDEGPMFGGDGDNGFGPGGPGGPGGDGDGDGDGNDGDAAVIIPRDYPDASFSYTPPVEDGGTCANDTAGATLTKRPVDIIISIDNSGSMAGEIQAVIDRINGDFATIIEDSDIDYRVIMVSRYGHISFNQDPTNFSVCIGPPLGAAACPTAPAPALQHNEPIFYHHSTDIGSNNMWCRLLDSYDSPDEIPNTRAGWISVAPNGWQDWLRTDALKVFVGITDDRMRADNSNQGCSGTSDLDDNLSGAQQFDETLRTLAPTQFGAYDAGDPDANRNYIWHSIVGLTPKAGAAELEAYQPAEPIVTTVCEGPDTGSNEDDGVEAGEGYQYLSQMTGGLRYSNCLNDDFDAIFNAIAEGVIQGAVVNCDFEIPEPTNPNAEVNFDNVTVTYLEGGASANMPDTLSRVGDINDCASNSEYYLGVQGDAGGQDFNRVFLCPDTCTRVQADADAEISVGFGCLGQ